MKPRRLNLPNAITTARILACPLLFVLLLSPETGHLAAAFGLFVAAALSDLWDGYLARRHGLVTDVGKLLDPLADKLLLVATLVPFYIVSQRAEPNTDIPWWGPLPLWVVVVILGRELVVTLFRSWAARKGSVVSAGPSGKLKALTQNVFAGALILWYVVVRMASDRGWDGSVWAAWSQLHGAVVALSLGLAVLLTVYSMGVYYVQNRSLLHGHGPGPRT